MLHYKPGEKSPKEKYEMMLEGAFRFDEEYSSKAYVAMTFFAIVFTAFRPLHPEGARLETTVNFLNDDPRAVLKDCKLELHQKVIIPCEFQQPDFVNRHFGEILGSILWKPEIFNPDLQMRNFAFKFTYFTPRVLRNKMPLFRGCLVNDLFSHYAKHRDTNREQGIEEMTNETMKFIREIAIRKEDDVNNIDMRQLI